MFNPLVLDMKISIDEVAKVIKDCQIVRIFISEDEVHSDLHD
jgi:hypothetical protein